ncbi:MAG: hypothetical protein ACRDQZ_16070 [Mycobacteriales bacterium]
MPAELHLHFHGCVRPLDLLRNLAVSDHILWDWYETEIFAAYGAVPPTRQLVERYRRGDFAVADDFEKLFIFGDPDAGTFARFQAKANLLWVASAQGNPAAEIAAMAAGIRADQARQGLAYVEMRISADMFPVLTGGAGSLPSKLRRPIACRVAS